MLPRSALIALCLLLPIVTIVVAAIAASARKYVPWTLGTLVLLVAWVVFATMFYPDSSFLGFVGMGFWHFVCVVTGSIVMAIALSGDNRTAARENHTTAGSVTDDTPTHD